jgi:sorbitol-specific phosphotransferase system component IIA
MPLDPIVVEIETTDTLVVEMHDQGPPGVSGASFVYSQGSASDTWAITHNLDRYPSVTVVDSLGREVEGDVRYIDSNHVTIYFTAGFAGQAYLN